MAKRKWTEEGLDIGFSIYSVTCGKNKPPRCPQNRETRVPWMILPPKRSEPPAATTANGS